MGRNLFLLHFYPLIWLNLLTNEIILSLSTKYSMQESKNDTQGLDNSSFSLDKNAKQNDDLTKTNYIEYFRKDNGDVKVYLMDSNNNLVNKLSLCSNTNNQKLSNKY